MNTNSTAQDLVNRLFFCAGALCGLFLCAPLLRGQQPLRQDVSQFGMVGLAPGEILSLTAAARPDGRGCRAQLGFASSAGIFASRSLNVNLTPRQSASVHYSAGPVSSGRNAVRPVAWIERDWPGDCDLSLETKEKSGKVLREMALTQTCGASNCPGVAVSELKQPKLRLYVAATNDQVCRAQMGFRLSDGRTSATSRYVTLRANHAEWLDWRPGAEDFSSTDSVVPVIAFHKGDRCVASSEVFLSENAPATMLVPVHVYESPVVGLAVDPASISDSIRALQTELETNPKDLWVINALAQAYDNHGERQRAMNLLSEAVVVNPRASESWLLLAKFQYEKQDYNSAIESLEKCLALDPTNLRAQAAYADSLAKVRRLDEADKLFGTLLKERATRTPAVLTAYADFLYIEERFREALAYVEESDIRHPNCERTLLIKAQVLFALKRLSEATQAAERAVQIDSNLRLARLLLVRLYAQQGMTREAAEQVAWLKANVGNDL